MKGWLLLIAAILFEVSGTASMKASTGFTKVLPSILMVVFYVCSFSTLTFALKQIEVSVAYAIWSGIGTALIAIIGMVFFHESLNALKIVSVCVIILGVIGLNLSSSLH